MSSWRRSSASVNHNPRRRITDTAAFFYKVFQTIGELRQNVEQTYESQNLAPEDIDHEVVARYVEEHLLTDEAAIRDAVQRNRSFGQWMRDQLDKVLAKLGNEDARERVTLQKARDLYAQALKEKAASQGETDGRLRLPKVEESGNQYSLTEYSEEQKAMWENSRRIVIYESDAQLLDFVHNALENRQTNRKLYFGAVPADLASIIREKTGLDVEGYNCTLSEANIRKIIKDHGNQAIEALRDQRAITDADFARIPDVIQNADTIKRSFYQRGRVPAIVFSSEKVSGITVVAYVSGRHLDLSVQTMYAKNNKDLATPLAEQAANNTPKAGNGTVLAGTNIAQQEPEVKGLSLPSADTQLSMTEEEGPIGLKLPRTDAEQRIRRDAPEEERYEILKDKNLTAKPYDKSKLEDVDLSKFETLNRTETEKLLRKIGEQFGVFKKYRTQDVAVEFQFSRNNLGESVHKQGGRYSDYAKMLTVFDDVIENAIGIETHSERYANKRSNLKQMYVLASTFKTEDGVIPVLMEVKEFTGGRQNTLHLTVSLNAIAEADIVAYAGGQDTQATAYTPSASEYRIADIFKNVNIEDGKMLRYIPDGFLTDEQRAAKQKELERTEQYITEKNRRRYSQSITEEEDMGLQLPKVEDETEASGDASLREAEAQAEAPARKKTKPVAESRPIEARRWLNRQTVDKFGIPEGKRKAAAETVQRYADKMIDRGEVTEQDVAELFNALLYEGVVDVVPDDYSRTMQEIVTGGRIHAPVSVKADFGDDWSKYNRSCWENTFYLYCRLFFGIIT